MKKMKNLLSITSLLMLLAVITLSCNKENSQDQLKTDLNNTETLLQKSFQLVKSNDDSLALHVGPGGQFTDPRVMMEDSLYHMNDSLCNIYYLTYCKEMIDGDNMMGGNMMGGDTMHGNGMMMTHTFMGDTATVNQYYRELMMIRQLHPEHHPVKP
jgi:hypothetical protein